VGPFIAYQITNNRRADLDNNRQIISLEELVGDPSKLPIHQSMTYFD